MTDTLNYNCFTSQLTIAANLEDLKAISLVEWKAVGLLLGISDGILESIQQSHSSSEECQHAMLKCWISSGQAYWSTLVEALRSPLLGEEEIADDITKRYLSMLIIIINLNILKISCAVFIQAYTANLIVRNTIPCRLL